MDRVTIIWADGAIQKQWLQVTVKATENTGLAENDVFYYGNAVGDSGDSTQNAYVNATDQIGARDNPHGRTNLADITDVYDFNRDKYVNATDQIIARDNATGRTNALVLMTAPSVVTTDDAAATDEDTAVSIAVLNNDRDTKGGALSVYRVDAVSSLGASLTINPDQTIRYDPSLSTTLQALLTGQSLWDTFTYTIKDSKGLADTATVKVLVSGLDEPVLNGGIEGTLFNDANGNGIQDSGEAGLAGRKVYVDLNGDGHWDTGEPYALTDTDGNYAITGLPPGTYDVLEALPAGWEQTTPSQGTAQQRLFTIPTNTWPGQIVELDPANGSELERFATPDGSTGALAYDGTSLFYVNGQTLWQLNPDTGAVIRSDSIYVWRTGGGYESFQGVAALDGELYLLDQSDQSLVEFDPGTHLVTRVLTLSAPSLNPCRCSTGT